MLKTIQLEDGANHNAFHTLSADEIDLVAGGVDWNSLTEGVVRVAEGAGLLLPLLLLI